MSNASSLLPLAALIAFSACDDDLGERLTAAAVEVEFQGTVGAEALALESATYQAPGVAEGFRMSRLSFFLSEVELISETDAGELGTDVAEVAYVEFGADGRAALRFEGVPVGRYVGLRFNLGLTEEQDGQSPVDFAPGHPLADPAEYWVDWGSYVFLKVEGRSDTLADGRARFDRGFVYHVGRAAENTRRLEVRAPISVSGETAGVVGPDGRAAISVDVEELLGLRSAEPLSLVGAADHENSAAAQLMDNAARAFTRGD